MRTDIFTQDLFNRYFLGGDSLLNSIFDDQFKPNASYPPYNNVRIDDDHSFIELAVTGFNPEDVSITVEKDMLTIAATSTTKTSDVGMIYLHRGLGLRNFTQRFKLVDHISVTNASIKNGILTINFERQLPEELKPKTIPIQY